jgi:transcriptional regulator with XRE-family HTH domain
MNKSTDNMLARLVRDRRLELQLSMSEVARRAQTVTSLVSRTESGDKVPRPEALGGLATALELPLADLYEAAGYPLPDELPSLRPYLRRAYGVPDAALPEIEQYLAEVARRHGGASQPQQGEDEAPDN